MDYWTTKLIPVLLITVGVYCQEVFNTMPPPVNTNFTCRGRDTGFYADVETNCRVYHTCDDHGNKFTYYCPEETAFRQEALVCDHARLVDCAKPEGSSTPAEDNEKHEYNEDPSRRSSHERESSFNQARMASGRSFDVYNSGNSNPAYTRSFRITAEPSPQFPTPKSINDKQPTFVLNSSVFLRDRVNSQKSPSITKENRVATTVEGSNDFAKNRVNKNQENNNNFSGQLSSAILTTTLKPFDADLARKMDFRGRYFGDGEGKDGFSGGFSSTGFGTTRRPFERDFKDNFGNAMGSQSSNFGRQDERVGLPDRSTSIGSIRTTIEAPRRDFKVEPAKRNPSDFEFRNFDMNDRSTRRLSLASSTTTLRPFGTNFKVQESSGDVPSFGNVKSDGRSDDSGSRITFGGFDPEETPKKGFQSDDKRRNDQKSDFRSFGSLTKNSGVSSGFGSSQKDAFTRNSQGFDKNNGRPSFFSDNNNFPYSETLRSMQAKTMNSARSESSNAKPSPTKTISGSGIPAGTEFPVHAFAGVLSSLIPNELEDDPYYPKRSTTTEAYYKLSERDKGAKRPFRFSTRSPWPGSLDFEIPEVLPDLNTLDDLVDRRKLFFIPRVKAT